MDGAGKDVVLDIRGQVCPATLLVALREMNRRRSALEKGAERLRILTDNRDATATIPEAARNMGYDVRVDAEDGAYQILVRRAEG